MSLLTCEDHGDSVVVWEGGLNNRISCPVCDIVEDWESKVNACEAENDDLQSQLDDALSG